MANVKNYRKQGGEEWVVEGELNVQNGGELKVDGSKMNNGVALFGAMVGGYGEAEHGGDETTTVAAADDDGDRKVLIVIKVTDDFTGTNKPKFQIGETGTIDKFFEMGEGETPEEPDAGEIYVAAGTLTDDKALIITKTDASGGTEAGSIEVFAIILPEEA